MFRATLVFILLLLLAYLAAFHVSVESHLMLVVMAFLLIVIFSRLKSSFLRVFVMLLGGFISIRYLCWRFVYSIPWESQFDLPFALMLFTAESYGILIYLLGMFITLKLSIRQVVPIDESKPLPSIDVFITTYDERLDVVTPTIVAAVKLRYSGQVNVYVLDDGGTTEKLQNPNSVSVNEAKERADQLKNFCDELNVNYIARRDNEGAKAGNINYALEHTHGELILVLDADHVPTRDFLINTVGAFQNNGNLGFLQTPHFFITSNPIEKNLELIDKVQPENEMFYNSILIGMDNWNSCFFCGSAALLRRAALLEVGGLATQTITEDADTSVNIHAKGWDSAYLNKPMIAGLSPDTFQAYMMQRMRWCQGMIQVFMLNNPITKKGLDISQRLCYLNATLHWLFPIFRTIFLISPLLYLLFDIQIFVGDARDFLFYVVPHLLNSMVLNQMLFGKTRKAFFSELYETALALYLFVPAIVTLFHPRPKRVVFRVTPKGETTKSTAFSRLTPVMMIMFILIFFAEVWGVYLYLYNIDERGRLLLVLIFNTFNFILVVLSLSGMLEVKQRRKEPRLLINEKASVEYQEHSISAVINDISLHGARLTLSLKKHPIKLGDSVDVHFFTENGKFFHDKPMYRHETVHMVVKATLKGGQICCECKCERAKDMFAQHKKMYGRSERWEGIRHHSEELRQNLLISSLNIIGLFFHHFVRVLRAIMHI
ncbi:UDP-forming cellulose synthase catalytic subunit [Vibrio caribbeanicus]|uniref:UDP-forming cellulose synthase catalytic subunit n=1 Tax=Vibrio caribbeanicus TaxID=701175 RepID=UPI0030D8914E